MQRPNGDHEQRILNYPRHFGLLACVAAALTATGGWRVTAGAVASFGLYGATYSAIVALTISTPHRQWLSRGWWLKPVFVLGGAALSMTNVGLSLLASRFLAGLPQGMGPALLLTLSSGFGAATFARLVARFFGAHFSRQALCWIMAVCATATLALLASGLYAGGAGQRFALVWWCAFSAGAWVTDGRMNVADRGPDERD